MLDERAGPMGDMRSRLPLWPQPVERPPAALDGIRVIDFTRVLAGPFATQILGDLGAEVIKVEMPGKGDDTRFTVPEPNFGGESTFFLSLNRNKQSIALDLNTPEGIAVALDLIATADVVAENFTSRVMRRYGLDYASLKERFPRLIYCSVSAYGRTGSLSEGAGYDSAITAEAGVASLNARPGEPPVASGLPYTDITTAMNATIATLAALQARQRHGIGQMVEAAMYDTAIANLSFKGYETLATGRNPALPPRQATVGVPRGEFDTENGAVWITCAGDKMFRQLMVQVFERPDLADDLRFRDRVGRDLHAEALLAEIKAMFAERSSEHWSGRCKSAGVPCGVLRTVDQALMSAETAERGMLCKVPHPTAGDVPIIQSPIRLWSTPTVAPSAAPLLGQHGAHILRDVLGYDDTRIAALVAAGAVALPPD